MTDLPSGDISSAQELVSQADLIGIRFHQLSGTLNQEPANEGDEPSYDLIVARRQSENHFGILLTVNFEAPDACYVVAVDCAYRLRSDRRITDAAMAEFIERVAVMAAFPFVREALHDLSRRLGAGPVVLGLLRPGDIKLEPAGA